MQKFSIVLKDFLNALILHCFFCTISFLYITPAVAAVSFFLCILVSAAVRYSAVKVKSNLLAFIISAAVSLLCLAPAFMKTGFKGVFFVLAAAVFAWSIIYRYAKFVCEDDCASIWFLILFISAAVIGTAAQSRLLIWTANVQGILFLGLNLFFGGVGAHEKFIKENQSVQNFPKEQIRKTYIPLLAVFCALCFLCSAAAMSVDLKRFHINEGVSSVLHNFYEFLPKHETKSRETDIKRPETPGVDYARAAQDFGVDQKTNQTLETIGTVASVILLVLAVIAFLIWILRRAVKNLMLSKIIGADKIEFVYSNDKHEKTGLRNKKSGEPKETNNKKIRKLYKKYVLKNCGEKVRPADTPKVIENAVNISETSKKEITKIYEKARYSGADCTKDELETLKKYIKSK